MAILYLKILHLVGAFCLFAGFGGMLAIGENRQINRLVFGLHGLGLLLLFLGGFAMQGIGKYGFPGWLIAKIVLWLAMVALFVLMKRRAIPIAAGVIVSVLVGGVVGWLCLMKPF